MNKVFDSVKGETKGTVPSTGTREIEMKPGLEQKEQTFYRNNGEKEETDL